MRLGRVEIFDLEVAFTDDVVITDDDACDGRKKDGVSAEIGGEVVGGGEEFPEIGC